MDIWHSVDTYRSRPPRILNSCEYLLWQTKQGVQSRSNRGFVVHVDEHCSFWWRPIPLQFGYCAVPLSCKIIIIIIIILFCSHWQQKQKMICVTTWRRTARLSWRHRRVNSLYVVATACALEQRVWNSNTLSTRRLFNQSINQSIMIFSVARIVNYYWEHSLTHIVQLKKLWERNLASEIQHKTSIIKWESLPSYDGTVKQVLSVNRCL